MRYLVNPRQAVLKTVRRSPLAARLSGLLLMTLMWCVSVAPEVQAQIVISDEPSNILIGPDTVTTDQAATYQVDETLGIDWSGEYFWHVEGADSIQGVALWDYQDDGIFQTDGPMVTVYPAEAPVAVSVKLFIKDNEGKDLLIASTTSVNRPRDKHILADEKPASPSTNRGSSITVCANSDWAFGNRLRVDRQYFKIVYYTESGNRYEEMWMEKDDFDRRGFWNKNHPPTFYARWYEYVPVPVPGSTYPTANSTDQPDYHPSDASQTFWSSSYNYPITDPVTTALPGERIIQARVQSYAEDPQGFPWVNYLEQYLDVYYSVIPISSFSINAASLCLNQTYSGSADINADTWYNYSEIETRWYDLTTQQFVGVSNFTSVPGGSRSTTVTSPVLPLSTVGHQVQLQARPIRRGATGWPCSYAGAWATATAYRVSSPLGMPASLSFQTYPILARSSTPSGTNVLNEIKITPVSGALNYYWVSWKLDGNTGRWERVNTLLAPGTTNTSSSYYGAETSLRIGFQDPGFYRVVVYGKNSCDQPGPALTQEFRVGGPATCPPAYNYYNLPPATMPNGTTDGLIWLPAGTFNPAWSYSFTVRPPASTTQRVLRAQRTTFNLASNQWESVLDYPNGTSLPTAGHYLVDLVVITGNGQIPCTYDYEDYFNRSSGTASGAAGGRLSIFPNPTTEDDLTISTPVTGHCHWAKLFDQQGNLVREVREEGELRDHLSLSMRHLLPGLYTVRAFDGERVVSSLVSRQ